MYPQAHRMKAEHAARIDDILLLRRPIGAEVEFITIMRLDLLDAVREFAGEDYETAVVPSHARALLARFDARSQHHEIRAESG